MKPIETRTSVEAWLQACEHLLLSPSWRDYTIVLEIEDPLALPPADRAVYGVLDNFLLRKGGLPVSTVVNTIFPAQLYLRHGVQGVYERYPTDIYPQVRKHPDYKWGTYFHRLLQRKSEDGKVIYPLRDLIEKMTVQLKQSGPNRAIYEAGTMDIVEDIPIYSPDVDRLARSEDLASAISASRSATQASSGWMPSTVRTSMCSARLETFSAWLTCRIS